MDFNLLTSLNDNIRIDRNKCTACGRCVEVCILDNLRLQLSPCRQACPVGMNCQAYIHQLAQGKMDKGLEKIREAVPFGGVLGRICSRPCEAACNRIKVDRQPVAIRDLKRFLADQDGQPWLPPLPEEKRQKIAVVGAGPAGLTAAFYLRSWGFRVTLYDRESAPGGLMRWAIPEFRLPLEVLEREFSFLKAMGIGFEGNRTLGQDLALEKLTGEYDAVLLALGVLAVGLVYTRGKPASRSVCLVLAFLWAWMAVEYHLAHFALVNPAARIFGVFFLIQAVLLLVFGGLVTRLKFERTTGVRGAIGWVLLGYGLVIYQILGILAGHGYFSSPTFGVPCPTVPPRGFEGASSWGGSARSFTQTCGCRLSLGR